MSGTDEAGAHPPRDWWREPAAPPPNITREEAMLLRRLVAAEWARMSRAQRRSERANPPLLFDYRADLENLARIGRALADMAGLAEAS